MRHAYAIVEDPDKPGCFFSLHLENVIYERAKVLEPSARSESLGSATQRMATASYLRGRQRKWK